MQGSNIVVGNLKPRERKVVNNICWEQQLIRNIVSDISNVINRNARREETTTYCHSDDVNRPLKSTPGLDLVTKLCNSASYTAVQIHPGNDDL